jgi:hypothetical protein
MASLDKIAREAKADEVFLELLTRFGQEGRNASEKLNSPNYAPTLFAREAEAKKIRLRREELGDAMSRLFAERKIRVETYGRPSQPHTRLVLRDSADG